LVAICPAGRAWGLGPFLAGLPVGWPEALVKSAGQPERYARTLFLSSTF